MTEVLDVAVIGAGPYGLSIAAHLSAAGIEHRVFGVPMESWRDHMPPGMFLKSHGDSSSIFDPRGALPLETFSRGAGVPYHHCGIPVRRETFVEYGLAFQSRFVPNVVAKRLVGLNLGKYGHELRLHTGEMHQAKNVIVATGAVPFAYVPDLISRLPDDLAKHSSAYGSLKSLSKRKVLIVGGGSSAMDIAALLGTQGSDVTVVTRRSSIKFQSPPTEGRSLLRHLWAPDAPGLGTGWTLRLCAVAPEIIHMLPDRLRSSILERTLGPSSGYFIKETIEKSSVVLKVERRILQAVTKNGCVQVTTADRAGNRETVEVDQLIAATGYRVNLGRLSFLGADVADHLRTIENTPILSRAFESSVPGLFFVGLPSARSFGPLMRFVVGAKHPARRITAVLQRRLARGVVSVADDALRVVEAPRSDSIRGRHSRP